MDHLTTIIVHYNTPEETLRCIASVLKIKARHFTHQILVIDNGSKENLELPAKLAAHPNVELVRSDSNLGFAGGNNLGIKHAISNYNSDFVILLNSDTTVDPSCFETLWDTARNHPEVGLVNPKIYFTAGREFHQKSYAPQEKGKVLWFAGASLDWADVVSFHRGVDEVDRGQFDHKGTTDFATGCCVLIRREVLESVGLLSEDLFLYWEDVEYSLRVKDHGYKLLFQPKAIVWHDNAGSGDGAGSDISLYYQTRNRLYLAFRNGGWLAKRTAARLVWKYLRGNAVEQRAVIDALVGKMGQQPLA
jgi:GT2 family glycosyltransferase